MKPLLIGEANPYGADPEFALYPRPKNASGWRLCSLVMGLDEDQYLEMFERRNLCPETWSMKVAREEANKIRCARGAFDHIVLLGSKVCSAFGEKFEPFTWSTKPMVEGIKLNTIVILPHPSGLNRIWGEPGSFDRARAVLRCSGVIR